ncbi:hypothetical protein BC834DRAFT_821058 [Gloeopeniophorella convolvens]|nr:hypothetical protein BC834DRAFT_821058 [Gloeopeniophorella convolvens]
MILTQLGRAFGRPLIPRRSLSLVLARASSSSSGSKPDVAKRPPFEDKHPFKLIRAPNTTWAIGDGLSATPLGEEWNAEGEQGWKSWEMSQTPTSDIYKMLSSAIIPRPIAFVSTLSAENSPNLAPFRYGVAYDPPVVSISFTLSPGRPKDTRDNILATREFVVNLISEPYVEAANATSVEAPSDVSEWEVSGLSQEPSLHVKPARVKESAVSLECELFNFQDIFPDGATTPSTTLVLSRVKCAHVRHSVLQSDGLRIDPSKLRVVSRLGGLTYARVGEGFNLKRPAWNDVKQALEDRRSGEA